MTPKEFAQAKKVNEAWNELSQESAGCGCCGSDDYGDCENKFFGELMLLFRMAGVIEDE